MPFTLNPMKWATGLRDMLVERLLAKYIGPYVKEVRAAQLLRAGSVLRVLLMRLHACS